MTPAALRNKGKTKWTDGLLKEIIMHKKYIHTKTWLDADGNLD